MNDLPTTWRIGSGTNCRGGAILVLVVTVLVVEAVVEAVVDAVVEAVVSEVEAVVY